MAEGLKGEIKFLDDNTMIIIQDDGTKITFDSNDYYVAPNAAWNDPAVFDEETKAKFFSLPAAERNNFIIQVIDNFYRRNPEYAYLVRDQIYNEPVKVLDFFKKIELSHFKKVGLSEENYKELQQNIKEAEEELNKNPIDPSDIKLTQIWPLLHIRDNFAMSVLANLYYIQNKEALIKKQNTSRKTRKEVKKRAIESNAIMEIKGGNYPIFSQKDLWNAFTPGRIVKMGTLDKSWINEETGEIMKFSFDDKEIIKLNSSDISLSAFIILNAIISNSVDNVYESFVKDGEITFYVKGILKDIAGDPKSLLHSIYNEDLSNVDRKNAGMLYFENLFLPLTQLIGTTPNGSRYAVLNYAGYNAESDTITIRSPYLYQFWKKTQEDYFIRQNSKTLALSDGKKPPKNSIKPLEINQFFKGPAINADPITLEIAIYITNVILNAGVKGKKTDIECKTLIEKCPRLKEKLTEIEENKDKKYINKTNSFNMQLKKISSALDLIQDKTRCEFLNHYSISEILPTEYDRAKGKNIFILPTKKTYKSYKLTILWDKNNQQFIDSKL